jgi:hypothetical protein
MKAAQFILIEDNSTDVLLVELALKENGIPYELTRFKMARRLWTLFARWGRRRQTHSTRTRFSSTLNTPRSDGDGFQVLGKLIHNHLLEMKRDQ